MNKRKEKELVVQPINHLMLLAGYDGVYAENASDNSWNRGLVAYNYEKHGAKVKGRTERL